MDANLRKEIAALVRDLVDGRFEQLVTDRRAGRMSASMLQKAIREYGRHLVPLPEAAWSLVDLYPAVDCVERIAVDIPLWTEEEGRSDLTLSATATRADDRYFIEIDDIHVP